MTSRLNAVVILAGMLAAADKSLDEICFVDSTDNLQATLESCTERGTRSATVVIKPNATMTLAGSLRLYSNLKLVCEAGAVIMMRDSSATAGAAVVTNADRVRGNSHIYIEGCVIDGNKRNQPASANDAFTTGMSLVNVANVRLTRLTIRNTIGIGIYGHTWQDVEIDHSRFTDWRHGNSGAIELHAQNGASKGVRVHHNQCDGSVSHSSCFKFLAATASRLTHVDVSHNDIRVGSVDSISTLGIELWGADAVPASDSAVQHFVIVGNIVTAEDPGTGGTFCISLGGVGVRDGAVMGNTATDCRSYGIEVIASHVTVANNTLVRTGAIAWNANDMSHSDVIITGNVILDPVVRAIHLIQNASFSLDGGIVMGNIIRAGSATGIRLQNNDTSETRIFNVKIVNNNINGTPAGLNAIETLGRVAGVEVSGNRLANIAGQGLSLGAGGRDFIVIHNYFSGSGTFLSRGANVTMIQNGPNFRP